MASAPTINASITKAIHLMIESSSLANTHDDRLTLIRPRFDVAGGYEHLPGMQHRRAIYHSRGHHGRVRRKIDLPDFLAILQPDRVHDALEVTHVYSPSADGSAGEEDIFAVVCPLIIAAGRVDSAHLSIRTGEDRQAIAHGHGGDDSARI